MDLMDIIIIQDVLRLNVTKNGNGLLIGQTITGIVARPYQC